MTTVFLAPAPINCTQFLPGTNNPANGAQLFSYITGTSTKQNMYTTSAGNVTWANPLVLDSGGNIPTSKEIWIPQGLPARFVLAPSNDTDPPSSPYWTIDNISGVNDVSTTSSGEWTVFTPTATFAGATSFTVVNDQTAIFTVGRRLKTTNTSGTIYSTITASSFAAGVTTVTVVNDSGVIDSGLSAVSYGVLSTPNGSIPWLQITSGGLNAGSANVTTKTLQVLGTLAASSSAVWGTGIANFGTITKRKSADQSVVSSTVLVNDTDLTFAIAANEEWCSVFEATAGNALGVTGLGVSVTVPSGATLSATASLISDNSQARAPNITSSGTEIQFPAAALSGAGNGLLHMVCWTLNGATPGSVTLQFTQMTSSATAVKLLKGSFMQATRVA